MGQGVWRCQDDHGTARPGHPPLRHHRDRQRQLSPEETRLIEKRGIPGRGYPLDLGTCAFSRGRFQRALENHSASAACGVRLPCVLNLKGSQTQSATTTAPFSPLVNFGRRSLVNVGRPLTTQIKLGRASISFSFEQHPIQRDHWTVTGTTSPMSRTPRCEMHEGAIVCSCVDTRYTIRTLMRAARQRDTSTEHFARFAKHVARGGLGI